MAKKDFDREYLQVEKQYLDMLGTLKDMEKEFADGLVAPETLEQLREMVQPVVNNYKMWSYVKFLLDKPTRKDKVPVYVKQTKKLQEHMKTFEQVKEENQQVLDELSEYQE